MVYPMWMVMELSSAKQQAQKMQQGAARRELRECESAERVRMVSGPASIVPLWMPDLHPHARFAINVDESLCYPLETLVTGFGNCTEGWDGVITCLLYMLASICEQGWRD
jgi:hypothetical protein